MRLEDTWVNKYYYLCFNCAIDKTKKDNDLQDLKIDYQGNVECPICYSKYFIDDFGFCSNGKHIACCKKCLEKRIQLDTKAFCWSHM